VLDTETKRRIDTARDILVGKVPDPKSQVRQITIALIYKFMDDMDAEAEEFGGERKFFAGEFGRYGWAKLMRSGLGGHEILSLYAEAISKMPENPGVPTLFRDIFKDAYLPYRDPETLRMFLKVIDEFTYDHSEKLGDAYEYLLSIMSAQGDAGQFRTPRHYIDFIVEVVDPKKNERILDPACGTAGFPISSYKHIIRANSDANGQCTLTPDEKGRLAQNLKGYDIAPEMVQLSLVNMYLHGFSDPHIYEYDTLTSLDRWNEYADVILANPPFMSPKGGIKPHNRFSIQSKRSEVLFVDYMAEHLTPNGRAGIIVPEGIIFQSQTAYVQLRKMLVEEYLVAVVSLPAGVFNPYSGVKTSILILDKSLAKKADTVAFFKVEKDGYSLGAQRKPLCEDNGDKPELCSLHSDLPQVLAEITEYLRRLRADEPLEDSRPALGLVVPKAKLDANGDYNLSAERYREVDTDTSHWPMVPLGTVSGIESGSRQKGGAVESGIPSIGGEQIDENGDIRFGKMRYVTEEHFRGMAKGTLRRNDVLLVKDGATTGKTGFFAHDMQAAVNEHVFILRANDLIHPYFLYCVVRSRAFQDKLRPLIKGIIGGISLEFSGLTIPLPPLEVQKEIATEVDGYRKVIDGARGIVDNYRPHIPVRPDWPMVELSSILQGRPTNGYSGRPVDRVTSLKVLMLSATTSGTLDLSKFKYLDEEIPPDSPYRCRRGDIYLQRGNTAELVGTAAMFDVDAPDYIYPDLMIRVRADETKIDSHFLLIALQSKPVRDYLTRNAAGSAGSMPKINQGIVERIRVPLAPLATQRAIVAEIEAEQAVVAANRELVARMEKKIQSTVARVWGENEPAPAEV